MVKYRTMDFSTWLAQEVEKRGWSFNELARRSGVSSAMISLVMTGHRNPGVDFCNGVARAFKTSPIVVLAKAGIIPPLDDNDLSFRELWHHVRKLSHRDRAHLIQIAKEWSREKGENDES
jgi:transcriptional regulator with XRE-family HTH domain